MGLARRVMPAGAGTRQNSVRDCATPCQAACSLGRAFPRGRRQWQGPAMQTPVVPDNTQADREQTPGWRRTASASAFESHCGARTDVVLDRVIDCRERRRVDAPSHCQGPLSRGPDAPRLLERPQRSVPRCIVRARDLDPVQSPHVQLRTYRRRIRLRSCQASPGPPLTVNALAQGGQSNVKFSDASGGTDCEDAASHAR